MIRVLQFFLDFPRRDAGDAAIAGLAGHATEELLPRNQLDILQLSAPAYQVDATFRNHQLRVPVAGFGVAIAIVRPVAHSAILAN